MNITTVLRDSFQLVKKHPMVFVPMLAFFILVILLSLVALGSMYPFGDAQSWGDMSGKEAMGIAGMGIISAFIVLLISGFVGLLVHGMTIAMVDELKKEEKTSLASGWKKTRGKLVPLIISALAVSILTSIGFLLLVLPGVIAVFLLMFVVTAAMVDDVNGFSAVGRGVRTVVKNLKVTIVLFLILVALAVIFGIVNMVVGLIPILGVVLSMLISAIFGVYVTAFLVLSRLGLEPEPEQSPEAKA